MPDYKVLTIYLPVAYFIKGTQKRGGGGGGGSTFHKGNETLRKR